MADLERVFSAISKEGSALEKKPRVQLKLLDRLDHVNHQLNVIVFQKSALYFTFWEIDFYTHYTIAVNYPLDKKVWLRCISI